MSHHKTEHFFHHWEKSPSNPKVAFPACSHATERELWCREPFFPQMPGAVLPVMGKREGQDDVWNLGSRSPTLSTGPQTFPETGRSFNQMKLHGAHFTQSYKSNLEDC